MPEDQQELKNWLSNIFQSDLFTLDKLCGDASERTYFRVCISQKTYILMNTPLNPSVNNFITLAKLFYKSNISVPEIYFTNINKKINQGWLILEDFGDNLLLSELTCSNIKNKAINANYYYHAIDHLIKLQNQTENLTINYSFNCFNQTYYQEKLDLFYDWYILKQNIKVTKEDLITINNLLIYNLKEIDLKLPHTVVHLDYHSRNLIIKPGNPLDNNIGIIDFQDAMLGNQMYDVLSLLQDAYIVLPKNLVDILLNYYINNVLVKDNRQYINKHLLIKSFYLHGLHRHLKNLAVFNRLSLKFNKPGYLRYIPVLIDYITDICNKYPEYKLYGSIIQW